MGELILNGTLNGMIGRNAINSDDVLLLRATVFRDGVVQSGEADAIFALDRSCTRKCAEWNEFYVEALSEFLVANAQPQGYVSVDNARWLIRATSTDDLVQSENDWQLLLRIMKKAKDIPSFLSAFALRQVAHAVISGEGVLARDRKHMPGVVTAEDVEAVRTIIYSASGDGGIGVSRDEAEVLFDINDASSVLRNDPSWSVLFAKAIAASLMMATGYKMPDRETAKYREAWLDDTSVEVGSFFSRIFSSGLRGFAESVLARSDSDPRARSRNSTYRHAVKLAEAMEHNGEDLIAERIEADEAHWLAERIGRDGLLNENEKEILRFIKMEAPHIHPSLQPLLEKVA